MRRCEIDGCDRKHVADGLCSSHYKRVQRFGDPIPDVPIGGARVVRTSTLELKAQAKREQDR